MKKILATTLITAALCGCVSAPFKPPMGLITEAKAPLSTDGNWNSGMKRGTAKVECVLGVYSWGDCSITEAAKNGGLKRIDYVDYRYQNIFGIYQLVEVFAYGE